MVRRRLVTLVVATVLVAACSSGDDNSAPGTTAGRAETTSTTDAASTTTTTTGPEAYTGTDFYTPPDPLPAGEHGALVRYQAEPDFSPGGGTAYRVMYLSESLAGDPIAVTGTVIVPTGTTAAG